MRLWLSTVPLAGHTLSLAFALMVSVSVALPDETGVNTFVEADDASVAVETDANEPVPPSTDQATDVGLVNTFFSETFSN